MSRVVPTHLKIVRGNPGKRPIVPDDVRPTPELPPAPDHLNEPARKEWNRMSVLLFKHGLLTGFDVAALACYCQLYGRWVDAEIELQACRDSPDAIARGLMIATTNANLVLNPLVGAANKAAADVVRYCVEFGMTPSARTRIHGKTPDENEKKDDPIASYGV